MAGIQVPPSRVAVVGDLRWPSSGGLTAPRSWGAFPYLSAASVLQASRDDDHAYTELADAIRPAALSPPRTCSNLWRRMVFNLLITNVDDHLQTSASCTRVRASGAGSGVDLNPFPDKGRNPNLALPEQGPSRPSTCCCKLTPYFSLTPARASATLAQVVDAVGAYFVARAVRRWVCPRMN